MNKIANRNPNFQQLSDLAPKVGFNQHLGSDIGGLNLNDNKDGKLIHQATGFRARSAIGDTKRDIRNALVGKVGQRAADRILKDARVKRFDRGFGPKVFRPNGEAVNRNKLENLVNKTNVESIAQSVRDTISPLTRAEVFSSDGKAMSLDDIQQHPELGPAFTLFAETDYAGENIVFQREVQTVHDLIAKHDTQVADGEDASGTLQDIRDQASKIKDMIQSGDYNVNEDGRARIAIKKAIGRNNERPINSMGIDQLRELTVPGGKKAFIAAANNQNKGNLNDVKLRFCSTFFDTREESLEKLEKQHDQMKTGDHLRGEGSKNYVKSDHAKAHFWGGKRASKFAEAKANIRRQVVDALGGDTLRADAIMKPFANSKRALTKANLKTIINDVKAELKKDADALAAHNARFEQPVGPVLDERPTVVSENPQQDYQAIERFISSYTGSHVKNEVPGLVSDLEYLRYEQQNASTDGTESSEETDYAPEEFKADVEEVLGKLEQHGYTIDQIRDIATREEERARRSDEVRNEQDNN